MLRFSITFYWISLSFMRSFYWASFIAAMSIIVIQLNTKVPYHFAWSSTYCWYLYMISKRATHSGLINDENFLLSSTSSITPVLASSVFSSCWSTPLFTQTVFEPEHCPFFDLPLALSLLVKKWFSPHVNWAIFLSSSPQKTTSHAPRDSLCYQTIEVFLNREDGQTDARTPVTRQQIGAIWSAQENDRRIPAFSMPSGRLQPNNGLIQPRILVPFLYICVCALLLLPSK